MNRKRIIQVILVLILFVGEVWLSFSIKTGRSEQPVRLENLPYSHRLNNNSTNNPNLQEFDNTISKLMHTYGIKGSSVAVARNGKLMYAKGYGIAIDSTQENIEPKHMFRIASVSKLLTATAIMKLIEERKLSLDNKVFGEKGILNDKRFQSITDPEACSITIEHLLKHQSGLYNKRADLMFIPVRLGEIMKLDHPAELDDIIEFALNKDLDYSPGTKYDYSNLGYAILGKIIEETSNMPYEEYVKFKILQPLGIYDMRIGNTFFEERVANEVQYFENSSDIKVRACDGSGELVSQIYGGNNIELLAASGGWIASPIELMKFLLAIDGNNNPKDILSKKSIDFMTHPFDKKNNLVGWKASDGKGTVWRSGTLAGTGVLALKQPNNTMWVIMINTTTKRGHRIHSQLAKTMFTALSTIDSWPKEDLFQSFETFDLALSEK